MTKKPTKKEIKPRKNSKIEEVRTQGRALDKKKTMALLEPYLSRGLSVTKSCEMAGIEQKPINLDDLIDQETKDNIIPEKVTPRAKYGQVWKLGNHRLMCGSSTEPKDIEKLLDGEKVDMVFTDPPYNVNYSGRGKDTSRTIENDHMEEEQFDEFLDDVFKMMHGATKEEAPLYIFHSSSTQIQFEASLNRNKMEVINQIIWNKPTASMGWGDYRFKHEPMFYAKKKGSKIDFYGDRTNTTIIDFTKDEKELIHWAKQQKEAERQGLTTIWTMKRDSVNEYVHPTQKPVELIEFAVKNSSIKGESVLDLFGGSGSTMIACEKLGRRNYSMELDPEFVDIIIQRWEDYTKEKAILTNK